MRNKLLLHQLTKDFFVTATNLAGSRYQLAKLSGVDESNLSKMARGDRSLSIDAMVSICDAIGLDPWPWTIRYIELTNPSMGMHDSQYSRLD